MSPSECSNCGGKDIRVARAGSHRSTLSVTAFRSAKLEEHVCLDCGLVETFVSDLAKWRPLLAEKLPRAGRAVSR